MTFLRGGRRHGVDPDARPPRPEGPEDQGNWRTKISPGPTDMPAPRVFRAASGSASRIRLVEGPCEITVVRGSVGLRLRPYRAPITPNVHRGLIANVQSIVGKAAVTKGRPGLGDLAFAIAHHARTAVGRKGLRTLLAEHVGSSNRSSLSLLSAPFLQTGINACWEVFQPRVTAWGIGTAAWVNTGDAELLAASDLGDREANYRPDLTEVRMLALPHHGSDKNSDGALLNLCPNAVLVAHARAGARKHPGVEVSHLAGGRLALVTEEPGTAVHMRVLTPL